ncbi:hypothetical protein Bcep18194_C7241 [Burkholderia lata]|uniref:Uncharacterized protein n=1 Tax=Burkholderia lata (strain ATCC 17760 / DSM 23089 / LMG 22485 / NCIMB 9086 / R18194 / 383) TaxID=482957 RepID=Q39MN1_BURL3|nr:hypothetical protein Bcep18194_C7241 [Burkholderia lata]
MPAWRRCSDERRRAARYGCRAGFPVSNDRGNDHEEKRIRSPGRRADRPSRRAAGPGRVHCRTRGDGRRTVHRAGQHGLYRRVDRPRRRQNQFHPGAVLQADHGRRERSRRAAVPQRVGQPDQHVRSDARRRTGLSRARLRGVVPDRQQRDGRESPGHTQAAAGMGARSAAQSRARLVRARQHRAHQQHRPECRVSGRGRTDGPRWRAYRAFPERIHSRERHRFVDGRGLGDAAQSQHRIGRTGGCIEQHGNASGVPVSVAAVLRPEHRARAGQPVAIPAERHQGHDGERVRDLGRAEPRGRIQQQQRRSR